MELGASFNEGNLGFTDDDRTDGHEEWIQFNERPQRLLLPGLPARNGTMAGTVRARSPSTFLIQIDLL
ncbi:MAG TPA: hypothetical protein DEU67_03900 [Acidobacteria bacterium]|nr:hypothetical protein [Acidobacteriota bacterium]